MATPGELVKVVAAATGEDEPTVAQIDRSLHLAGLRTKGGRGPAAAKVTPRDAAHLLTAMTASTRPRDAVEAVHRYQNSAYHETDFGPEFPQLRWANTGVPEFEALRPGHSFIDALEAIIAVAMQGRLWPLLGLGAGEYPQTEATKILSLRINVWFPRTHGRIYLSFGKRLNGFIGITADYTSTNPANDIVKGIPRVAEIGAVPILMVGALLAGKLDELPPITGDAE
ncbi:hypothetical protein ACNHKD_12885 [Methylocystis sp. JAN1]|uniref:hypothetical protein n=1 Tax=Methylocystis sp. JAN1 TaxID=3397211 RepID=UPI003FA33DFB